MAKSRRTFDSKNSRSSAANACDATAKIIRARVMRDSPAQRARFKDAPTKFLNTKSKCTLRRFERNSQFRRWQKLSLGCSGDDKVNTLSVEGIIRHDSPHGPHSIVGVHLSGLFPPETARVSLCCPSAPGGPTIDPKNLPSLAIHFGAMIGVSAREPGSLPGAHVVFVNLRHGPQGFGAVGIPI